jgi:hypothetical protein
MGRIKAQQKRARLHTTAFDTDTVHCIRQARLTCPACTTSWTTRGSWTISLGAASQNLTYWTPHVVKISACDWASSSACCG